MYDYIHNLSKNLNLTKYQENKILSDLYNFDIALKVYLAYQYN